MVLWLATILLIATVALAVLQPRWRRPMLWGALFGWPLAWLEILFTGSIARLGVDRWDVIGTVGLLMMASLTFGALGAGLYEWLLGRWLNPRVLPTRPRLLFLGLGPLLTGILIIAGTPVILAIIIGLITSTALIWLAGWSLFWDAWLGALGWAGWYFLGVIILQVRFSGDLNNLLFGSYPIGITIASVPIEELLIAAGFGALIGPLYAATKLHRHPDRPRHHQVPTPKVIVGSVAGLLLIGILGWGMNEFVLAPQIVQITPRSGANGIASNTTITVSFTHPIDRDSLNVGISPEVSGTWKFARPTIGEHGWRTAQFVFDETLAPDTTYTVAVSNVASVWGSIGRGRMMRFTTAPLPDVAGSDHGPAQPADSCAPIQIMLTEANVGQAEFIATMKPAMPVQIDIGATNRLLTLKPGKCLTADVNYHLRLDRRQLVRSSDTQEVIAVGELMTVYETDFAVKSSTTEAIPTAPRVLGATSASGLTIIRPKKVLSVAMDYQDQPLSCEAAALKMALAGVGTKVTENMIMKQVGYDPTPHKGKIWGDPNKAFVGNIVGRQMTTGYGVYWGPIAKAAKKWRPESVTFSQGTVTQLTTAISAGHPVVIWGVMGTAYSTTWKTRAGKTIYAWKGEHARTVIGFYGSADKPTAFVINDPIAGRLTWSSTTLLKNWAAFNRSGVIVQ